MKYLGGKHAIGLLIADIISGKCPPDSVDGYLEPFCGSLGVFKHMTNKQYDNYTASDIQPDLIDMWKKIQNNTLKLPTKFTEENYNDLKISTQSPNAMKAIAGFFLSYGGKYFAGYSQKWAANGRDFFQELKNSIEKIKPTIQSKNIKFLNDSYLNYSPNNMLIYCDPPYESTQNYSSVEQFDNDLFWDTMRKWSKNNCVFISEQNAPSDFKSIWSKTKHRTLNNRNKFFIKEHLFVYDCTKSDH